MKFHIFLPTHTLCTRHKHDCDTSLIKGTLREEQCTFSPLSWLAVDIFSSRFISRTLYTFPRRATRFVARVQ